MSKQTGKVEAVGAVNGSLERLRRIERVQQRLWFLVLLLLLSLAIGLFLLDATSVLQDRARDGWPDRLLGALHDYAPSGALLIIAWLTCAYFCEKLLAVRAENRDLIRALGATARILAQRNQQLDTWSQLSHSLITGVNLPRLLDLIVTTAADVTESDCAAVLLAEKGSDHLRLAAIHERGLQIELAERVAAVVIKTARGLRISPDSPPEEFDRPDLPWEDLSSLAAEPLIAGQQVVGALLVGRRKPSGELSSEVLDILQSFASQASIALEKAHLYAENEKQLARLGKLLDDLHAAQSQLSEVGRTGGIGVLSGGVAYVVTRPIAAIMAHADRLLSSAQCQDGETRAGIADIRDHARRVAETLTGMLALSRRPSSGRLEVLDLNLICRRTLDVVRGEYAAARIEVEESYGSLGEVRANAFQVQQAILNLFVNALHGMPLGGSLAIRSFPVGDDYAELEMEDSKGSMPSHIEDNSLDRFGVPHMDQLEANLGLAAAERIIHNQGGTLRVDRDTGLGTRVVIRFPICRPTGPASAAPQASLVTHEAEPVGASSGNPLRR